mmetsp:Transcript_20566/g.28856  ORF Transcript_20566/g.28856 Transcript_20566/m.28856 type:complete len:149 (+) Transcript_20566:37-483(+)
MSATKKLVCHLTVTVVSGKDLAVRDITGSSDPYVHITVIDNQENKVTKKAKTTVQKQTLNPVWNEKFTFKFDRNKNDCSVRFHLWDWDRLSHDDSMGYGFVSLKDVDRPEQPQRFLVKLLEVEKGTLEVIIEYAMVEEEEEHRKSFFG